MTAPQRDGAARFHGIYPMLYAFFDAQGALDRAAMARQVEACLAQGAHGIAALGLATEVSKLSEAERRQVMDWVCSDVAGRCPVALTIFGNSVAQQVEMARAARDAGADWLILQPPPVKGLPEIEYIRFFGAVAEKIDRPIAIQNAPDYIGIGLSAASLFELNRQHPNVCLLKGEGPALTIRRMIEETEGRLTVFNGRGGLELPDNLRPGCAGMIPAPDCFDRQIRIFELMRGGDTEDEAAAEALYREILPAITFVMQSIETLLCYGKRIAALRLGLAVQDRAPALQPSDFGLTCARRYAEALGPLTPG